MSWLQSKAQRFCYSRTKCRHLMFRVEQQNGAEVQAIHVFMLQMQSMESCLECLYILCALHVWLGVAAGPWNPASIPCAPCSSWTPQGSRTLGWRNASAVQPLRTYATTTRKSACTLSFTSGPLCRSWRDIKRWGSMTLLFLPASHLCYSVFNHHLNILLSAALLQM